jgi:hypothetical protein
VKESLLPWLSGQILPASPTTADYDRLGLQWREEIVLPRRHRTTKKIIRDAWQEERPLLLPVPARLLHAPAIPALPPSVIDLTARRVGEHVEIRDLAEYEAAL